jgi:hypothetical protein
MMPCPRKTVADAKQASFVSTFLPAHFAKYYFKEMLVSLQIWWFAKVGPTQPARAASYKLRIFLPD